MDRVLLAVYCRREPGIAHMIMTMSIRAANINEWKVRKQLGSQ